MKRIISFFLILAVLLSILPWGAKAAKAEHRPMPFRDVAEGAWYRENVQYIYDRKLMNGTAANLFSPEEKTTRAMLVTILHRLAGSPNPVSGTGFQDVKEGSWCAAAISWAAEQGIVNGVNEKEFAPDAYISREQTATILFRYAAWKNQGTDARADLTAFPDGKSVSAWASDALSWAVAEELVKGVSRKDGVYLLPQDGATRAQLAALLHRFCVNVLDLDRLHIAYIPLDNRPVNNQRPVYQMEGADIRVHMPEESLYATRLDGQEPNPNGTAYGDREALLAWLKEVENDCDVFVLSLDQLLSGGLVNSRAMNGSDLSLEYEIMDYLEELSKKKPVYIFDTVMRIASTVGYLGLGLEAYNAFRSYGTQKRAALTGEELTIENIYAGYRFDEKGEPVETALTEEDLKAYHDARRRKLSLADYLLREVDSLAGLLIGVDDSYPLNSIQTNEIAYLRGKLAENQYLFCGTDELGMMAVTRAYCDYMDYSANLSLRYFGGGEDWVVDQFATETLQESMQQHMEALNMSVTEENAEGEILVLSRGTSAEEAAEFMAAWLENEKAGIFTVAIDTSGTNLTFESLMAELPVKHLLGYSCWGTGANAMGISLSMGISRLCWLKNEKDREENSVAAFQRALAFAFVKDIAYCRGCRSSLTDLSAQGIEAHIMSQEATVKILQGLQGKEIAAGNGKFASFPQVSLSDFSAPFARTYEVRFAVLLGEEIYSDPVQENP